VAEAARPQAPPARTREGGASHSENDAAGCIFPTLWIILLGPAILIIMRPRG